MGPVNSTIHYWLDQQLRLKPKKKKKKKVEKADLKCRLVSKPTLEYKNVILCIFDFEESQLFNVLA